MPMGSIRENPPAGYDADFFRWTQETAELLRQGRFDETDKENLAEEVADMGKRDRRELQSRMIVLVMHLMKWAAQPQFRGASWVDTISEQRVQIDGILDQSPSLRSYGIGELHAIFRKAAVRASKETRIPLETFQASEKVPALDRLLAADFFPANPSDLIR
jgi:hypothetical protein